ncbi:ABC transporter ATP-binding protein [[Eubacterium] cellulosolvens]
MVSIEVKDLTKRFGTLAAVDHLSFTVKKGEVFGLLGPNGAGKTTTVRILACLISPSEGSATVNGYDILKKHLRVRENVGILTENPSLYERLTAAENMEFFAEAYGISSRQERYARIKELLQFFDLWERRNIRVSTFSKGMKQKLAIARALVHNPPILLLDEPTSGLDPESAKNIRDLMQTLSRLEKRTILLCTHRLEDAERLCSRVMIIDRGRRIITGSPSEIQDKIDVRPIIEVTLKRIDQKIIHSLKVDKHIREVRLDRTRKKVTITVDSFESATPEIVKKIVRRGGMILSVNHLRPSLEEAYLKLVAGAR